VVYLERGGMQGAEDSSSKELAMPGVRGTKMLSDGLQKKHGGILGRRVKTSCFTGSETSRNKVGGDKNKENSGEMRGEGARGFVWGGGGCLETIYGMKRKGQNLVESRGS